MGKLEKSEKKKKSLEISWDLKNQKQYLPVSHFACHIKKSYGSLIYEHHFSKLCSEVFYWLYIAFME